MNETTNTQVTQEDINVLKKELRKASNHNSVVLLIFLGFTMILSLVLQPIIQYKSVEPDRVEKLLFLGSILIQFLIAAPLSIIVAKLSKEGRKYPPLRSLFRKPESTMKQTVRWIFIGFFIGRAVSIISVYFFMLIEKIIGRELTAVDFTSDGSSFNTFVNLLSIVILAPIIEELIFRGILANNSMRFGKLSAIITSGLCFGLYHMNYEQVIYAASLGIVLAFLLEKTKSIIPCIIFHVFFNIFGAITSLFPGEVLESIQHQDIEYISKHLPSCLAMTAVSLGITASMVIGLVLLIIEIQQHKDTFKLEKIHPEMTEGQKILTYFTAPATVVLLIIIIALTVANALQ